jgi:hypothetical protein
MSRFLTKHHFCLENQPCDLGVLAFSTETSDSSHLVLPCDVLFVLCDVPKIRAATDDHFDNLFGTEKTKIESTQLRTRILESLA